MESDSNVIERWECQTCGWSASYPAPSCSRNDLMADHGRLVQRTYVAVDALLNVSTLTRASRRVPAHDCEPGVTTTYCVEAAVAVLTDDAPTSRNEVSS